MKRCSRSSVIGEMQIQTPIRHHRIRMPKNQTKTELTLSEYVEQLEFSYCWCKMAQLLTVSCKIKHTLPIQPRNRTPTSTSKRNENLYPHKNLYMTVYGGLIFNGQKLETTQMFTNWWVSNQSVLHPYVGILFSNKKEWRVETGAMWINLFYPLCPQRMSNQKFKFT